jgi:hypothetical protein
MSEGKAGIPTKGLKEDRGRIDAGGSTAEPGWREEEVQIAAAEDGTETA